MIQRIFTGIQIPEPKKMDLPMQEPRNAAQASELIRKQRHADNRQRHYDRMYARGIDLFLELDKSADSTTGYLAQCQRIDGELTGWVRIGKPRTKGSGDYTESGNGPYWINVERQCCGGTDSLGVDRPGCPFFPEYGTCKHVIGLLYWLATWEHEITVNGVIRWIKEIE